MNSNRVARRQVIWSGFAGIAAGVAWSTSVAWATRIQIPTIDVIGKDESQLLLLDTGAERVLLLSGPLHPDLVASIPDILGLFRQRVDILLAGRTVLDSIGDALAGSATIGTTFSFLDASDGTASGSVLQQPTELTLSHGVSVRWIPQWRYATEMAATWRIEARRGDQIVAIASSLDHLATASTAAFTLAVAPTGSIPLSLRKSVSSHFAMNARVIDEQMDHVQSGAVLIRVFDEDAAQFELHGSGIRLPGWAVTIDRDRE
jgi:hypothetical protein